MKVIKVSIDSNILKFVPRNYNIGDRVFFEFYEESTRKYVIDIFPYTLTDGIITVAYDTDDFPGLSFIESAKFQIKITDVDSSVILYRGKAIATDQVPQDYKLTSGLYE